MTAMPLDDNGVPIPCMALRDGGAHTIAHTSSAAGRNTTAFKSDTQVISFYSTTACFIKFSNDPAAKATSADHYFPAGIYYNFELGGQVSKGYSQRKENKKYISVLSVDTSGTAYVSEYD